MQHLPRLIRAGVFPMTVPGCNRIYQAPTVALHLHDYAGEMWIGRKRYRLEPGDITLSPNGGISRYALKASGTHLCVHFSPAESPARAGSLRLPLHQRLGPRTAAARERIWRVIDHMRQAGDSAAAWAASAALQELLLWLHLQTGKGTGPRRSSLVEMALGKLVQAIEGALGKPMLIGELAKDVGLSPEYVARLFAQRYGMTLQRYLLLRRIDLARHLLVSSDLPVSEVGRQAGIPDPQYFNKQFRRVAGESPLAYRKNQAASRSAGKSRRSVPR